MDRKLNLSELPAPFVPAGVDLKDFPFMPLEIERLRRSKSWLIAKRKPAVGFYMTNVWMGVWHNVPAGSIEDDDDVIADVAMCDPRQWDKVKADVMRGWVKCSDGRLYHPVVAEKVMAAWNKKVEQRLRTAAARISKMVKRLDKETDPVVRKRLEGQIKAARDEYERDALAAAGGAQQLSKDSDGDAADEEAEPATPAATGHATGAAAVAAATPVTASVTDVATGSKGEREGEREGDPPPTPSKGAKRASPEAQAVVTHFLRQKDARWPEDAERHSPRTTLETLAQQHLDNGATVELLTEVIDRGMKGWTKPTPPRSLLAFKDSLTDQTAAFRRAVEAGGGQPVAANDALARPFDPHEQARARLRAWAQGARWESHWGEPPGHPMCQIPKAVVLEEIPGFKPGWKPPVAGSDKGAA